MGMLYVLEVFGNIGKIYILTHHTKGQRNTKVIKINLRGP